MAEPFEQMLTGGHPNSLGRTEEVVAVVLADNQRFAELFDCYGSTDPVVRLRVSSAMKRIDAAQRSLLLPYIDRFIGEIGELDQPSAQWTLAQLFQRLSQELSADQHAAALKLLQRNLAHNQDWIVLNTTMDTLVDWAADDKKLTSWLRPHLKRLTADKRKSVSKRAAKHLANL